MDSRSLCTRWNGIALVTGEVGGLALAGAQLEGKQELGAHCEKLWGVKKPGGPRESACLPRWRAPGPAVGLPVGVKMPALLNYSATASQL